VPDFCREPTRVSTSVCKFHFDGSDTATGDGTNDRFDHHHDDHYHLDCCDHHDAAPHDQHIQWSDHDDFQLGRDDDPWGRSR
jgi:hypothetical protein